MAQSSGSRRRVDAIDLHWIEDLEQLKSMLTHVAASYKPQALPETLKYYIPVAGGRVLSGSEISLRVGGEVGIFSQGSDLDLLELELKPDGFKLPLTFIYMSQRIAKACKDGHQLLLENGVAKKELLAYAIPPYEMSVSLEAMMETRNACSDGKYLQRSDIEYFIAIFPNEHFKFESFPIATCSGENALCKLYSRVIRRSHPYDILAIGKALFK